MRFATAVVSLALRESIQTGQSLIDNVTLPNYLQAHMEPGGD